MAKESKKGGMIAIAIAAVVALLLFTKRAGGGTTAKYKVGDVLHNSDYNDDFLIQAIVPGNYRLIRLSTGALSDIAITDIDSSTIWTLVQPAGPKFKVADLVHDPVVGTFPVYRITAIQTIQGLLRYVGVNYLTGGYWDFPVAIVDATWALYSPTGNKFQIGDVIQNLSTGQGPYSILAITDFGSGPVYMFQIGTSGWGIAVSVIDADPSWVKVA